MLKESAFHFRPGRIEVYRIAQSKDMAQQQVNGYNMLKSNNLSYNEQKNQNFKNLIKKNSQKETIAPRYGDDSITEDIAFSLHFLLSIVSCG